MKKSILYLFLAFCPIIYGQVVEGIDVSNNQGTIFWPGVANDNITFAYVKATEGATFTSSSFYLNIVNGSNAGVVVGAYHFARPNNNSATQEANNFINTASSYVGNGYLPPALDIEDYMSGGSQVVLSNVFTPNQLADWINTWVQIVQSQTGITPVIYMNQYYASWISSSVNSSGLWIADWDNSPTASSNNGVWSARTFKQYTDAGSVSGISGNVDLNSFNGTMSQFNTLISSGSAPSNDNCNGAIALQSNTSCVNTQGSVDGATSDNTWNDATCDLFGGTSLAADVFYEFTAVETSHTITVDPLADLDAVVSLYYGGSCFSLNEIDCSDNGGGNGQSEIINATNLVIGQTYWIRIYDYGSIMPTNGSFDVCVTHSSQGQDNVTCGGIIIDDDNSGGSNGNDNGSWEPSETIEVDLELINTGTVQLTNLYAYATTSSPYVTVIDPDISGYNDLNPGDSEYSTDFDFLLSSNCPPCTNITFNIDITSDQGTYTCSFVITTDCGQTTCNYSLSQSTQTYNYTAQQGSFTVMADQGCDWSASTSCSFATLSSTSGTGTGAVNFNLQENTTGASRTCTINVVTSNGNMIYTLVQDDNSTNCIDAFSSNYNNYSYLNNSGFLSLNTSNGCSWNVVSTDYSWITLISSSGTGNGIVTFEIAENPNPFSRTLQLSTPNGAICTIEQDANAAGLSDIGVNEKKGLLFPNPTDGVFRIETEIELKSVEIFNGLGQEVHPISLSNEEVDISNLQSGVYFVKIFSSNDEVISMRIIKR